MPACATTRLLLLLLVYSRRASAPCAAWCTASNSCYAGNSCTTCSSDIACTGTDGCSDWCDELSVGMTGCEGCLFLEALSKPNPPPRPPPPVPEPSPPPSSPPPPAPQAPCDGGYWKCKRFKEAVVAGHVLAGVPALLLRPASKRPARTSVSIQGTAWHINGVATNAGKQWQGKSVEGTLFNARMVNAVFDDLNEESRHLWRYPDTGVWDPERNSREFIAALPHYARSGVQAVTISLQGGSPCGNNPSDDHEPCGAMYNRDSSSFAFDGTLRVGAFLRMAAIIERADELGMLVFLQLFYPDVAWRLFDGDDDHVRAATDNTVDWLLDRGYENVVLDVCNECASLHPTSIPQHLWPAVLCLLATSRCVLTPRLTPLCARRASRLLTGNLCGFLTNAGAEDSPCPPARMALKTLHWEPLGEHGQLLQRIRSRASARGRRLLLSSSYVGGYLPCNRGREAGNQVHASCNELAHVDYINLHANNMWQYRDGSLSVMVDTMRAFEDYKRFPRPIVFSEDDGLCAHDGTMSWRHASMLMGDAEKGGHVGEQGSACYFHWDACAPSKTSTCALGQSVASDVSWGLFLGCCGFSTCPSFAHKYRLGHGFQCPPINWSHNITADKRGFFQTVFAITGGVPVPSPPALPPQRPAPPSRPTPSPTSPPDAPPPLPRPPPTPPPPPPPPPTLDPSPRPPNPAPSSTRSSPPWARPPAPLLASATASRAHDSSPSTEAVTTSGWQAPAADYSVDAAAAVDGSTPPSATAPPAKRSMTITLNLTPKVLHYGMLFVAVVGVCFNISLCAFCSLVRKRRQRGEAEGRGPKSVRLASTASADDDDESVDDDELSDEEDDRAHASERTFRNFSQARTPNSRRTEREERSRRTVMKW